MHCTCKTLYNEGEQKRGKKVNLQLGDINFWDENSPVDDPLVELFKDYTWPFQNPLTKEKERMSVFDVIKSQTSNQDLNFKLFPPGVLSKADSGIYYIQLPQALSSACLQIQNIYESNLN